MRLETDHCLVCIVFRLDDLFGLRVTPLCYCKVRSLTASGNHSHVLPESVSLLTNKGSLDINFSDSTSLFFDYVTQRNKARS